MARILLHGDEVRISADRGYDYPQIHAHLEENLIEDWVASKAKPGKPLDAWTRGLNHAIAQLRAVGEHPYPDTQAPVRLHQGSLSWSGEERGATGHTVCAGESVSGATRIIDGGINLPGAREIASKPGRFKAQIGVIGTLNSEPGEGTDVCANQEMTPGLVQGLPRH